MPWWRSRGRGAPGLPLTPRVSICLPTRDGARHVAAALDSAVGQTLAGCELLVVDDASRDETVGLLQAFAAPRLRLHRNATPLGIPRNWNECLQRAEGGYVKFLFQDDVLYPRAVEALVAALERVPEAPLAFGRRDLWLESGTDVFGRAYGEELARFYAAVGPLVRAADLVEAALAQGRDLTVNVVGEPSFVLLRREAALRAGGFDPAFMQLADWELWLRLARTGPLVFVDESVGRLRVHERSQSAASFRSVRVRRELVGFLDHLARLYADDLSAEARRALRRQRRNHQLRLAIAQVLRM